MHATNGLLPQDSLYFHSVAMDLAEQIRSHGWSAWKLFPTANASGNVALLAVLYQLFGYDPSLMIPINAAVHALGGLFVYYITRELATKTNIGIYAGIIAATLFIIFPSSLNWYGQIHKDGYAIAGTLLVLLTWLKAVNGQLNLRAWLLLAFVQLAGIALIASVRPYNLTFFLVVTSGALLLLMVVYGLKRQFLTMIKPMVFFVVSLLIIASAMHLMQGIGSREGYSYYKDWHSKSGWLWKNSAIVPDTIENYIITASTVRAGLIEYGQSENAQSMIDIDVKPQSVGEVLFYMPRALQIATLAPFPTQWFTHISLTRLAAVGEMFIYYLCLPGLVLLLLYNRRHVVWLSVYFACFFLSVYGFTLANIGSLYRVRYAYLFVMLLMGVLGWLTWLDKTGRFAKIAHFFQPPSKKAFVDAHVVNEHKPDRKAALGAGLIVMALTFLCFVGFFVRDILMAKTFGLGNSLDNFFIALMIPMFLVSVLTVPLGAAFVPTYLDVKERLKLKAINALTASISFWVTVIAFVICLVLYWFGSDVLSDLYVKNVVPDMVELNILLDLALPLFLFSGITILGNSILNAHGKAVLSSGAQLIVPLAAIMALLIFGQHYGTRAVMFGMVVGQILNLVFVQLSLKQFGVSVIPKATSYSHSELSQLLTQYSPQVVAAFFTAITIPTTTFLAMLLPEGAVSAFNLGYKVVLFATGLVGMALSTVVLPYFSSLIVKNNLIAARRELSFFLILSTFISVPISFGLYVYTEQIISLMFEGGNFDKNATEQVVRVMQYSVVQLPFFVCNALLLKFAIATKHLFTICFVAIIGLLITIGSSLILIGHMGVAGIAFGTSISMLISMVLSVLMLARYRHINYFDLLMLLLSWVLFVTLLMCVHFQSAPGIYATVIAYSALLFTHLKSLQFNNIFEEELLIEN